MNRKFLFIAVLLLALMTGNRAFADFTVTAPSGQELPFRIIDVNKRYVSVKTPQSGSTSGDLVIPSSVRNGNNTYTVTTIGDEAFHGCTGLTTPNTYW